MFEGILKDILAALKYFIGTVFSRPEDIIKNSMNDEPVDVPPPVVPPITPAPKPEPVVANKATLENFCLAIRDFEGAPGDRNYRNNNPGNCRFSSVGYASFYGHVGKDKDNFAIFKDYATGWLYLKNLVLSKVRKNPNQTIAQFMAVYAPVGDDNDPAHYAVYIARRLGVKADYPMRLIV